jgi:hypothetical protein
VGSERYNFSSEMKIKAHKRAELFNPKKSKDVHHIFPKSLAKKYNLPTFLVKTDDNAIALERDFHSWIHGNRLSTAQLAELLGDEMTEWDYNHSDSEIEWKGFDDDDYIFLAVAYLGIAEEYFNEQRVYKKPVKPKPKRRRRRR